MNFLDQFMETIKVARQSIGVGDKYKAYKMDSNDNDMRKMFGLSACHCCDYFLPRNDSIILIEETRLFNKMENIKCKYHYLNQEDKRKFVGDRVRQRIELKIYGTMLVLCRLSTRYLELIKNNKYQIWVAVSIERYFRLNLTENTKYHIWLVVISIEESEEKIFLDNLKDSLLQVLRGSLSKTVLDSVHVFSSYNLKEKLSKSDPCS